MRDGEQVHLIQLPSLPPRATHWHLRQPLILRGHRWKPHRIILKSVFGGREVGINHRQGVLAGLGSEPLIVCSHSHPRSVFIYDMLKILLLRNCYRSTRIRTSLPQLAPSSNLRLAVVVW